MEAPAHIQAALRNIREGLCVRWNPTAVIVRHGSYDALGNLRDPEFDPRWELWDQDAEGRHYRIMTLQNVDGSFRAPGEWLVNLINMINPANYGGDVGRMVKALIDDPNQTLLDVGEADTDDLIGQAAKWTRFADAPKERVRIQLESE